MESELSFSTADLAQTRFAISPMWEVVTSFRLLRAEAEPPLHRRWAAQVRPRLVEAGLDRGWLAELIPAGGYLADFLNPTPPPRSPNSPVSWRRFGGPLLSGYGPISADSASSGISGSPRGSGCWARHRKRRWRRSPRRSRSTGSWRSHPTGPGSMRLLEADVFRRARQVAELGAAQVLNELHESVRWDESSLRLVRRHCALTRADTGAGLLLVPSVFAWPRVLTRSVAPDPPQLAYPARGIGTLWEPRTPVAGEAVAAVLGRSRTLLLTELDTPASTTVLAQRSGLSAAGVSQHLTALRNAGLVTAHRAGRSVLYARTSVADALLTPAGG